MAVSVTRRPGRHSATGETPAPSGRHRLHGAPTGRRRLLAPLGVGAAVLVVLGIVAAVLPSAGGEAPDVRGGQVLADPAPAAQVVVPVAPTPAPAAAADPAPTATPSPAPAPAAVRPSPAPKKSAPTSTKARTGPLPGATAAAPATPTFGVRPLTRACHGDRSAPKPGDVICFSGALTEPLTISVGGTPGKPVVYSGDGTTRVPGIHAEADDVVIQGFVSDGADSTGIWAYGANVTIQDNTVTRVRHTDEDLDAIRFFGDGVKVLHNFVHDLEGSSDIGGSHVDCMQTYATSRPGSSNVTIQGNRCEGVRAQCLMAEGPHDDGGSGEGVSRNWLFDGNFCDAHAAAQSVALEDIQDVTISNNTMAGKATKAFALGKDSTGTVVKGNTIGQGYGREVGFDDESAREGYQGPPAR